MYTIRKATLEDADGIAYVHHHSWMESYVGIIDEAFLKTRTLERSQSIFHKNECKGYLVAEVNGMVVGFAGYGKTRDADLEGFGEIYALYVLRKYQKMGIGKKLIAQAIEMLPEYDRFAIWVLTDNQNAIGFYQHLGFVFDGTIKEDVRPETVLKESRLIKTKKDN